MGQLADDDINMDYFHLNNNKKNKTLHQNVFKVRQKINIFKFVYKQKKDTK